jgi:ATP adenylyltransferase
MVAPIRHEAELNGVSAEEGAALFAGLQRATRALQAVSNPDGFNVGANLGREAGAGVPGHLHFHAVPRWSGDTNFMTAVAEARVIPEDLRTTWKKLKAAWPEVPA